MKSDFIFLIGSQVNIGSILSWIGTGKYLPGIGSQVSRGSKTRKYGGVSRRDRNEG